ncbi:MAG: hypothetical protein Q4C18_05275 [Eubacteriales bacterium]|nr:hypothetical protein [Eubacteriales bacterium]
MIEKTLIKYLTPKLKPVPVRMEYPETKELPCVLIEKTGSGKVNGVKSATIAFQSMDTSLQKAAELNEKVKNAVEKMEDGIQFIGRCSLNSDYNFTDTSTKQYRYQAIYDITYVE